MVRVNRIIFNLPAYISCGVRAQSGYTDARILGAIRALGSFLQNSPRHDIHIYNGLFLCYEGTTMDLSPIGPYIKTIESPFLNRLLSLQTLDLRPLVNLKKARSPLIYKIPSTLRMIVSPHVLDAMIMSDDDLLWPNRRAMWQMDQPLCQETNSIILDLTLGGEGRLQKKHIQNFLRKKDIAIFAPLFFMRTPQQRQRHPSSLQTITHMKIKSSCVSFDGDCFHTERARIEATLWCLFVVSKISLQINKKEAPVPMRPLLLPGPMKTVMEFLGATDRGCGVNQWSEPVEQPMCPSPTGGLMFQKVKGGQARQKGQTAPLFMGHTCLDRNRINQKG